jgi:hypothetical protein
MRKLTIFLVVTVFIFCVSGSAAAYLYVEFGGTLTDVGSIDNLVDTDTLKNSNEAVELQFINDYVEKQGGIGYTDDQYWKMDYEPTWFSVSDTDGEYTNVHAFQLLHDPDYYLIKTGNADYSHWLFENSGELRWAVINFDDEELQSIGNTGKISHWGEDGVAPVPEPATMLLFGTGLIGLAGIGRRKLVKSKK